MSSTAAAPALLVLALLVGVTGCSEHTTATPIRRSRRRPRARPPQGRRSRAAPPVLAKRLPFLADTSADDGGQGSGNGLGLTGVRVAHHPGFDRVVFDLGGNGTPGWRVEYTTRPRYEGPATR